MKYPNAEKIIAYNVLAITLIQVKKADKAEVLSRHKLETVLQKCKNTRGDLHDKAVVLLKGIVQSHAFASGNRRTAFLVVKDFIIENNGKFKLKDNGTYARVMLGVRENYYVDSELKEWLKNGKIREFNR